MVRRKGPSDLGRYVRFAHVGVQFGLILVLFLLGGSWLDERLSGNGAFTVLGTFVGAGIGFYVLHREIQRAGRRDSDDAGPPDGGPGGPGGDSGGAPRRS
jgi:hypothetical protein